MPTSANDQSPTSVPSITSGQEEMFRTYAWSYFSFHADQRMKTFNFFLIVAGLFAGGGVSFIHEGGTPWLAAPFGIALSLLCALFWKLDERNRTLIANGETALKYLDSMQNNTGEGQMPHELRIFERDDFNWRGASRSLFRWGRLSYSQVIKYVYGLFGFLGVLLAVVSLCLSRPKPTPLPVQIKTIPDLTLVTRHAPGTPFPTQPALPPTNP